MDALGGIPDHINVFQSKDFLNFEAKIPTKQFFRLNYSHLGLLLLRFLFILVIFSS